MKRMNNENMGIYTFCVNIIITIFLLSSEGDKLPFIITTFVSNAVAIVYNGVYLVKAKKKILNTVGMILNILVPVILCFMLIKKII